MKNYELAMKLLEKGIAIKHYTFADTGIIVINLNDPFTGYVYQNHKWIDIV